MAHPVSAILLAAGRSRRMGRSKPLLPLGDQPAIRRCLEPLKASGIEEIVVVLGHGAEAIANALHDQPVTRVHNPDADSDMAGSVRAGLQRVSKTASAVLVCLSDHPLVTAATIRALLDGHGREPGMIVIPSWNGKKGHPTLFPRPILEELFEAPTLRHLVRRDRQRIRLIEVPDPGVVLDMDTPEDYRRLLELWAGKSAASSISGDRGRP